MILVIRISGLVEVGEKINETLFRLRLRKKYSAVLLKPTKENQKLLYSIRNFVAYGKINKDTLRELLEKRAQTLTKKKIDPSTIVELIDKKSPEELGIKPFFRLHPPRGGIKSKLHYKNGKGVLGDNGEEINDLVRRML